MVDIVHILDKFLLKCHVFFAQNPGAFGCHLLFSASVDTDETAVQSESEPG